MLAVRKAEARSGSELIKGCRQPRRLPMLNHATYLMLANAAEGQVVRKVVDGEQPDLAGLVPWPWRATDNVEDKE